jgi:hypothetical protein
LPSCSLLGLSCDSIWHVAGASFIYIDQMEGVTIRRHVFFGREIGYSESTCGAA